MQTLNMEQNYRRYSSSKLAVEIHMHAYLTYFNHPFDYLSPFNFFSSDLTDGQRLEELQVLVVVPVQADGGGNPREAGSW